METMPGADSRKRRKLKAEYCKSSVKRVCPQVEDKAPAATESLEGGLYRKAQFRQEYFVGRFLGKGGQGTVFLCTHKASGKKFACKSIYKDDFAELPEAEENLKQEIHALARARGHPHVVTLEAVFEDAHAFHLLMEFCDKGTLAERLRCKELHPFTEDDAARVFYDVVCAVMFLHDECGIMHRDLKAENVFLKSDGTIKLGDFGFATSFEHDYRLVDAVGSPLYMAPEMMRGQGYDEQCEVWSLGILLFNMLTAGEFPFCGDCVDEIYEEILQDDYPLELVCSPSAQDLVRSMLCRDPGQRPTLQQVLQHPWLH